MLHFFFWNIAVWQFYFLSKKQLHVSSFVDRCFVIVFSSSVFRFHRLLIVVVTFRLSFHRHRHQNLKPLSFTKTLSRGNQKVVNFVKTAILLYVQKTSTFSKDSQSLKVFLLAVLWNSRFRNLIAWIQPIKLHKREFDRLEKIQQFY